MPDPRSSSSPLGGAGSVVHNPLPSRFSNTTVGSSGPSQHSSLSSQPLVWAAAAAAGAAHRPSASLSRKGSLASSSPSQLPAVAEDGGIAGDPPPLPPFSSQHRPSRPGTFGLPSRDLTLVEAALGGDMHAARVALARGELPGKRDADGRDALLGCVAGWAVLKHFNKAITVRSNSPEDPDQLSLFLELLPNPSISLFTLNASYPVVQTGTLLTVACWLEKVDFVRALLGETFSDDEATPSALRGWVDPDGPDARGGTGLMYSAVSGHLEIAQLLLSQGARPDRTENSGLSAIWHSTGRPQMTWLLEDALRKQRAKEHKDIASSFQTTTRLVSLDPELYYSMPEFALPPPVAFFESEQHAQYGKTLLRAVQAGDLVALENLLFPSSPFLPEDVAPPAAATDASPARAPPDASHRQGVVGLVNFVDENGLSPLHHALRVQPMPSLAVVKLLFAAGADVNLACVSRSTPLHHLACLGGASAEATRRNFTARQRREQQDSGGSGEQYRTSTAGSSSGSTARTAASKTKLPTTAVDLVANPAGDVTQGSARPDASDGPSKQLPQVKVDDEQESFSLATGAADAKLKDIIALLLRLGASADFTDCAGALPLHFAAEFGSSREIVRALLLDDLAREDESLRERLRLPMAKPERVAARNRQNGLGLTPRDLCRVEFVDLFDMADQESKARKTRLLEELGAAGVEVRAGAGAALSRGTPDSPRASSTGSLLKHAARESILQPLAEITSLEEAAHNLEQICDNLLHVDKSLSSGLLLRVKEDLAKQNSIHPEPFVLQSPMGDPTADGIARLRRSFQTSSQRNSYNRFRPVSVDSTQSSWWSQPSCCYSVQEIMSVRTELDSLYRLFTNTAHMVARVLQFYSDVLQDEDHKLFDVEQHASAGRARLSQTADLVEHLGRQRDGLWATLEDIETDRHNRRILSQVADLAAAVVVTMSKQVLGAMRGGAEDLDLVRHIKAAASEAGRELEQMKHDVADIKTSVAAEAVRIIDEHVAQVRQHSADLVRSAVLPQKQPPADQRQSFQSPTLPNVQRPRTPSASSTPASPSSSTFALSPPTSMKRPSEAGSPATTVSRGAGPLSDVCSSAGDVESKPLPDWLLAAPSRKEDREEFVAASVNIREIQRDLGAVRASIERAEENEALVQTFVDRLPKKAKDSQEADERREAFRLMSLVFQQLDHLRQRRTELETDRDATVRVLDHFDEAEKRQDRQARLASVLQSHLRAWPGGGRCSTPRATGQLDLADSHHSEDVSFWPSGIPEASRRDPSHAAEADVAWDLRKISLRVEGAEGLLERIRDDWRLILKAMAQNRARCTSADKHVRGSQRKLAHYLQWRMDSIVVLWEYVSSDSDDDRSSFSNASSWVLDARDRLPLPDLVVDPLPLRSASAGGSQQPHGSGVGALGSPPIDSPPSTSSHQVSPPAAGAADPDDTSPDAPLALAAVKQTLKLKVHDPLRMARAEVARAVEWCGIVEGAKQRLDRRLAGE